ncbi:MAG: T9SS type A sorting domain-containing protein, partial [Chryseobacterium sp.]
AGSNIGGNTMKLPAAASYTYFQMPFNTATAPDTIRIDAQSSKWPTSAANAGSMLYLDKLWLKSAPGVGVLSYDNASDISVYPNPVTEFVFINTKGEFMNTPKIVSVYNALGAKVYSISSDKANVTLDLKSFTKGIYLIEIRSKNGVINRKFIKE